MKPAKRLIILLLSFNMLFLSGCWNYREVDGMSMVTAFAIDQGMGAYKYHVTFEFLNLADNKTSSKLLETDGDTIFDCIRNAIGKSEKKLFFSECKVVVINKDLASQGVAPLLDWLVRDSEPRINRSLVISKEKTAAEILRQKPVTNQLIGVEVGSMIALNSSKLGESADVRLYQAINLMAGDGISLILPAIKITETESGKTLELDGTAVFKQDKLIGYLNRSESKYLLFINDQIKGGLIVTSPKDDNDNLSLEIKTSQTKVTPVITNNTLTMNIKIKVDTDLGEDQTSVDYSTLSGIKEAEKSAAKTLEYGVNNVIKKVQSQYGSDIFGFGSAIYRDKPDLWKKVKPNWDETFRSLKYTISADIVITDTATTKAKIKVGE